MKNMQRKIGRSAAALSAVLGLVFGLGAATLSLPAGAESAAEKDDHAHDPTDMWAIARGGRLYDAWWKEALSDAPKGTHPAYPKSGKKKGVTTWRCKECHGWDYKGDKGVYRKGSHYTGIKGLRDMVGADTDTIHKAIMNKTHGYTEGMFSHKAMELLALFVSRGQMDMDLYIDRKTDKSRGNVRRGANYFQTICKVCHGLDGKLLNFHSADDPEYVGTVAVKHPQEFLHKVRFGPAGMPMPAFITQPPEALADILAYAQTLPIK